MPPNTNNKRTADIPTQFLINTPAPNKMVPSAEKELPPGITESPFCNTLYFALSYTGTKMLFITFKPIIPVPTAFNIKQTDCLINAANLENRSFD